MNPQTAIEKFVIAGGGTAGWLAAATLGNIFRNTDAVQIELVASAEVGTIGVGEATIPPLLDTLRGLGIDEADFIRETQATFKWGIEFKDWHSLNESYFHPFGNLGADIDGHEFFQCWLMTQAKRQAVPLMDYSPEACLSKSGKFFLPFEAQRTPLEHVRYALHLDASMFAGYLKQYALKAGVKFTEGHISTVKTDLKGNISALVLSNSHEIQGDFFIDCTGFKGLLIEEILQSGYQDWSHFLPCNRAVAVTSKAPQHIPAHTVATAKEAGWMWQIPLQHRMGNGYVFCSEYCSDEQAISTLLNNIQGKPLQQPRVIPFTSGIRNAPWMKNCLSLGLAQGFLEPLESTAIHLVTKSLALFIRMFPDNTTNQTMIDEFNRQLHQDYREIRDFLILHYCTTERSDSSFWLHCKNMDIPASLRDKLSLYQDLGSLTPAAEELFQSTSWYAVLTGMKRFPKRYNPTLNGLDYQRLLSSMERGRQFLHHAVNKQPMHRDFIRAYCQAEPPVNYN